MNHVIQCESLAYSRADYVSMPYTCGNAEPLDMEWPARRHTFQRLNSTLQLAIGASANSHWHSTQREERRVTYWSTMESVTPCELFVSRVEKRAGHVQSTVSQRHHVLPVWSRSGAGLPSGVAMCQVTTPYLATSAKLFYHCERARYLKLFH